MEYSIGRTGKVRRAGGVGRKSLSVWWDQSTDLETSVAEAKIDRSQRLTGDSVVIGTKFSVK